MTGERYTGVGEIVGELSSIEELRKRLKRLEIANVGELTYPTDMPYLTEKDIEEIGYFGIDQKIIANEGERESLLREIERTVSEKEEATERCGSIEYGLEVLEWTINNFKNVANSLSSEEITTYVKNMEEQIRNMRTYYNRIKRVAENELSHIKNIEKEIKEGMERYEKAMKINDKNNIIRERDYIENLRRVLGDDAPEKYMRWVFKRLLGDRTPTTIVVGIPDYGAYKI